MMQPPQNQAPIPGAAPMMNTMSNLSQNISNSFGSMKNGLNQQMSGFSSNSIVPASASFLDVNSNIAKFAFLILVVVAFIILFNLGIQLIGYFASDSKNPYLIKGQISGNQARVIPQDPTKTGAIPIPKSDNADTGLEFTWSVWLLYQVPTNYDSANKKYQAVVIKGDKNTAAKNDLNGFSSLNNAPGVYFGPPSNGESKSPQANSLWILMDTMPTPAASTLNDGTEYIEVQNVPINKYFHLAVRCQNKFIDVYINGTVVFRKDLVNVPKQNFYDVHVGDDNLTGLISDLRYFSTALTVIDINRIVQKGPNTAAASGSDANQNVGSTYLSNLWYNRFLS